MKVIFVDAGSIEFTRNVVTDLGSCLKFRGGLHLSLHDTVRLAHAGQPALDPNTAAMLTKSQAAAMCDDLFKAHRGLLLAACASDRQVERR